MDQQTRCTGRTSLPPFLLVSNVCLACKWSHHESFSLPSHLIPCCLYIRSNPRMDTHAHNRKTPFSPLFLSEILFLWEDEEQERVKIVRYTKHADESRIHYTRKQYGMMYSMRWEEKGKKGLKWWDPLLMARDWFSNETKWVCFPNHTSFRFSHFLPAELIQILVLQFDLRAIFQLSLSPRQEETGRRFLPVAVKISSPSFHEIRFHKKGSGSLLNIHNAVRVQEFQFTRKQLTATVSATDDSLVCLTAGHLFQMGNDLHSKLKQGEFGWRE